ncbi:NADP-dependent malic enzyme-like isoform X2 [Ptychodera flava]|uniref:NADP-dependent malic enzyme-like isoform X2 n=1 Tax=Ptychodera flava TaxID=63121 RepID=UPI00396A6084
MAISAGVLAAKKWGSDVLDDYRTNKGLAFSLQERQALGIHGLLPPVLSCQDEQLKRAIINYKRQPNNLLKYMYVMDVQDTNEKLFYRMLIDNLEEMMPIVYTPTVGLACQEYGHIYRRPRGLFITIHDKGYIEQILRNWPEPNIRAIVVTDGERILGLGDLGASGMGIPVGKLALYTACAGVDPAQTLPICIDVGTDNEKFLADPMYLGLRMKRVRTKEYDDLIDEFMEAVVKMYGDNCLVQFEDFGNHNAFQLLEKYKSKYCTFNDDIQGTASVAVAGILASLRVTGKKLSENKFLFQGAGEAAIGIANLLVKAIMQDGLSEEDARKQIWLVDSKGLVVKDRATGGINKQKEPFAHVHEHIRSLADAVKTLKPTGIIGVAAIKGAFTKEIIQDMASFNEHPIIFALSNPTSKAECTAEEAYTYTNGKCMFASGSPFDPVTLPDGRTLYPGQGNNAYIFPGVGLGIIASGMRIVEDNVFLVAAEELADQVTDEHLAEGRLYPPLSTVREVSIKIAAKTVEYAYRHHQASRQPEPSDKEAFVRSQTYSTDYDDFTPKFYTWPSEK